MYCDEIDISDAIILTVSLEMTLFGCLFMQVAILVGDIVGVEAMATGVGIVFGVKSIPLTLGAPIAGKISVKLNDEGRIINFSKNPQKIKNN